MKKIILYFCMCVLTLCFRLGDLYAMAYIYDEESGVIYLGGEHFEDIRSFTDKIDDYAMQRKLYKINVNENRADLIVDIKERIVFFELGESTIAVATIDDSEMPRSKLMIYDKDGVLIKSIKDAIALKDKQYFSWKSDGKKLVYFDGRLLRESHDPFESKGTFVYDVKKDEMQKIAPGGFEVAWGRHDDNIYIDFGHTYSTYISMYDSGKKLLEKTDKKGIIFSDDGKYYVGKVEEERPFFTENGLSQDKVTVYGIYDSANDVKVYEFKVHPVYSFYDWLGRGKFITNRHLILTWGPYAVGKYKIFDVDSKKTVRESKSHLIGWNKDMTKLVVYDGGGKQIHIVETISGKRLKSLDIPK